MLPDLFWALSVSVLLLSVESAPGAQPGTLDSGFDPGSGVDESVFALALHPEGGLIVAGDFSTAYGLGRQGIALFNSSGSLNSGFDPGTGANDQVNAVAMQDGKIIMAGYFTEVNETARGAVARLHDDGSLDMSFGPSAGADAPILALAVQSDGKVVVGGEFTSIDSIPRNRIARLNRDGDLDTTFDPGTGALGGLSASVKCLVLQDDGKVLMGGVFTEVNGSPRAHLARLHSDGSLETEFAPAVDVTGAGVLAGAYAVAIQSDGRILVAGDFTSIDGMARRNIARLNRDGSVDAGFDPGSGPNLAVSCMVLQKDGRIIIGGFFDEVDGSTRPHIARLNADGSLDHGFDPGLGTDEAVYATFVQESGHVIIGGLFTSVDGTARAGIARLHGDATNTLRLFNPVRQDGTFSVSVPTVRGRSYLLEFKNTLSDAEWNALPAVIGDGTPMVLQDAATSDSRRFYRVQER